MAKLLNWVTVEQKIRERGFILFTPLDLRRILGVSEVSVRFFLTRYTHKGVFIKLRRGLYSLSSNLPSDFEIANALYKPSYISLASALAYYHLIPEVTYAITSITTRRTYKFEILGKIFRYHRLKKEAFTGYVPQRINGKIVLLAEKEKAFVDYLYFITRKKLFLNERIDLSSLNKEKIVRYINLFQCKSLKRLMEDIYARG